MTNRINKSDAICKAHVRAATETLTSWGNSLTVICSVIFIDSRLCSYYTIKVGKVGWVHLGCYWFNRTTHDHRKTVDFICLDFGLGCPRLGDSLERYSFLRARHDSSCMSMTDRKRESNIVMGKDEDSIFLCGMWTKRYKEKFRTASSKNKISFTSVARH